ncbi:alpha/beta fold hydrolase [Streptomyces sp. SID8361]|uniref:alpha/beta fold hydrolase n=1 Tax=Streptomyces sp. MnatMP-M27 TaxID=1839768 RepID=UPI00081EE0E0|nr:alpha/beta fold hydrolase [Streptomyces sp. MnatMP-M27]MYU13535.1 alpha/beta fold hydrolase [Streptomyces sp. SID8361]SCG01099.1 tricorn interacting aminopeptidase F1. Serine peptidase. MEROPS family S33 [Streptomyces sp. MnatMP-M27]
MPTDTPRPARVTGPDGHALHTVVSGDGGHALIGLHGGPGGAGGDYLKPLHRLASPARKVVTFDQLGTGQSDTPPADYAWTLSAAVADVDAVRRACGAERIDLLGHSYGGMLALQYTLDHPDRVGRLVLSNTTASSGRITLDAIAQLSTLMPPAKACAAVTADALGEHSSPDYLEAVAKWLGRYGTANEEGLAALTSEALDPGPAGHGLWGDRLWFANGAVRGWDVEPRLGEITAPTLVIHGGSDMSSPESNRALAHGIRHAEWLTMNNNSHDMFEAHNVATYLGIIREFLNGWEQ